MSRPDLKYFSALAGLLLLAIAVATTARLTAPMAGPAAIRPAGPQGEDETETVDVTDYTPPKDDGIPLADDRVEDKAPAFDPNRVDRRPVEGFSLNTSGSVLKLEIPLTKPDWNPERLALHPSYAAALKGARGTVLPSVNLVDGKAKQFDDGLYAALDRAYYLGHGEAMKGHLDLIRRIRAKVAPGSAAADYLAAGLVLAGDPGEFPPKSRSLAEEFRSKEVLSKPIGFYTWDKALSDCFRVLRFFAQAIDDPKIPVEIGRVLGEDAGLRRDYERAFKFYAGLTAPLVGRTPLDYVAGTPGGPPAAVALFPPSTSRENELFRRLFPLGLPPGAGLMRELVLAIRSGKVDLTPREGAGWYDHQAYALETLLLPEKGEESAHLLLTKAYKKRMLQAFQALMTKRRETHSRQIPPMAAAEKPMAPRLQPRLRVEPNPTYYLRTARSYAFLAGFLESTLGEETLRSLKGLREGGERAMDLRTELAFMRDLFYGLHLLSCEDIGQAPGVREGELVDPGAAEKVATGWLAGRDSDPDLGVDTRVAVPVYNNPQTGAVRLWMTIGVRLDALDVSYARPPSLRPPIAGGEWKTVEPDDLFPIQYLIPVDEFAEVELDGNRVLDRGELRATCDRLKTKEKIVGAFRK